MSIGAREEVVLLGGPLDGEVRKLYTNTERLICGAHDGKPTYKRVSGSGTFIYEEGEDE